MIQTREYRTAEGANPFRRWYDRLDGHARAKIETALARLRAGNTSALKPVGSGVSELRIDWGPGYRVYLAQRGELLVILLGGSTKVRQQQEIEAATTRWMDYKQRRTE